MDLDEELLEAWRGGDRAAGDELVQRHFDAVCRFFRSKLGDDVEDLIQRTFLDCVESVERVQADNFRAYLFAVARNRLFDHLRRIQRRPPATSLGETSVADLGTSPSQQVAHGQQERLLLRALRHIPVDFQIALELAYWEGLTGPEIARVIGVSENTVRSRLSRARAELRRQVERLAARPELAASTIEWLEKRLGTDG